MNRYFVLVLILFLSGCVNKNLDIGGRSYVSASPERCSNLRFACIGGKEPFFDDTGCGCRNLTTVEKPCAAETITDCQGIYYPVCGWFDSGQIQCIKYPCAANFNNSCLACNNEYILYYTIGECPK
ncbi:MAG: hypothetical protein ABIJ34_03570 [archaeon]